MNERSDVRFLLSLKPARGCSRFPFSWLAEADPLLHVSHKQLCDNYAQVSRFATRSVLFWPPSSHAPLVWQRRPVRHSPGNSLALFRWRWKLFAVVLSAMSTSVFDVDVVLRFLRIFWPKKGAMYFHLLHRNAKSFLSLTWTQSMNLSDCRRGKVTLLNGSSLWWMTLVRYFFYLSRLAHSFFSYCLVSGDPLNCRYCVCVRLASLIVTRSIIII